MFSRDTRSTERPVPPPQPATAAKPQRLSGPTGVVAPPSYSQAQPERTQERPTSILGPDISIYGQQLVLKTKGSLLIQGHIEGDVHGESVTVDDGANVKGVITARTIAIKGGVSGELRGSNVILHERSTVDADITQQHLTVAEGANFEGSVKRAHSDQEVTPDLS